MTALLARVWPATLLMAETQGMGVPALQRRMLPLPVVPPVTVMLRGEHHRRRGQSFVTWSCC
jgi:hypothetical protein